MFTLAVASASADELKVDHTITLAITPDLPGKIEVRPASTDVTAIRALLVIDGKLHRISLQNNPSTGSFIGMFPSPWKRIEYRLQLATTGAGVQLSANYTAEQSCRNSALLAETIKTRGKLSAAREALLKEAILLDDDIRRLNYVERVVAELPKEAKAEGVQ